MSKLYLNVLDPQRLIIFRRLSILAPDGYLAGGTALALLLGHRRSFDFDIFFSHKINPNLLNKLNQELPKFTKRPAVDTQEELSLFLDEKIKLTFLSFPFAPLHPPVRTESISLSSLPDLASNKAYVIGRRGQWKDYVDLYFLLEKASLKIEIILKEAKARFHGNFDEKLFWEQLVYWNDLKDSTIDYVRESVSKKTIQRFFSHLVKTKLKL